MTLAIVYIFGCGCEHVGRLMGGCCPVHHKPIARVFLRKLPDPKPEPPPEPPEEYRHSE